MLPGDRHMLHKVYDKMVEETISGRMVLVEDVLTFEAKGPAMLKTQSNLTVNRKEFDSKLAVVEGLELVAGKSSKYGTCVELQVIDAIDLLRKNKYSREAIVYLDTNVSSVHFAIRNDTLETIVNVHSWDLTECPKDMIVFGILAQVVARCLNVQLGYIYYAVSSSYLNPDTKHLAVAEGDLEFYLGPAWPQPGNVWYAYSLRAEHAVKEFGTYGVVSPGVMRVVKV